MTAVCQAGVDRRVEVGCLGERLGGMRLREAASLESMRRSLTRHGQLTAIVVFAQGEQLEILDGFKRAHAARALGWSQLDAKTSHVDMADAKVQIMALHDRHGLTEIEEGWLVRSLHRDDGLSQPEIARRLGRHKSWVYRRLLLVEALVPAVQDELRLGLLASRAAAVLAQLPHGNQQPASQVVIQRGLTVRQTELLVGQILERTTPAERAEWIARSLQIGLIPTDPRSRAKRNEVDWLAADIQALHRIAARLQARLLAKPQAAFQDSAAQLIFDGLVGLLPVLASLRGTVAAVTTAKEQTA